MRFLKSALIAGALALSAPAFANHGGHGHHHGGHHARHGAHGGHHGHHHHAGRHYYRHHHRHVVRYYDPYYYAYYPSPAYYVAPAPGFALSTPNFHIAVR